MNFNNMKKKNDDLTSYLGHSSREGKGAKETQAPFHKGRKMFVQCCESQTSPKDGKEKDGQTSEKRFL